MTSPSDAVPHAAANDSDPGAFPPPPAPFGHSSGLQPQPVPRRSKKPLVATIVVAVLVLAGVGVFIATRSDDDEPSSAVAASALVRVNYDDEQLEVLDTTGDVVDRIDIPDVSAANLVTGLPGRVIFDSSRDGEIVIVNVADGSTETYDVPEGLTLSRTLGPDSAHVVLDSVGGGDVVVIDLETGATTSAVEEVADSDSMFLLARAFATGTTYNDVGGTAQSLVVPDVGSDLWLVPGFIIYLDGDRSIAVEPNDDASTVTIDARAKEIGSVDVDGQVRGGVLTGDDTALVVTAEGDIVKVDVGKGEVSVVDSFADPITYAIALSADRIFVAGDGSTSYLLDATGKTVAEFEAVEDDDGNKREVALGPNGARPSSRCFVTQAGPEPGPTAAAVALRDQRTGEILAEFDGSASVLDTPDGCTAVSAFDRAADIALDGDLREFDGYDTVLAVSSDLKRVVVHGEDGLALIDVASGDETDLDNDQYAFVTS